LADSGALRTQRYKRHKAGDHSLCRRCDGPAPPRLLSRAVSVSDPIGELRRLAGRLRDAHEADPGNALIARELRMTLQALTGGRGDGDAELESLFAELGAS
jgi:hypothetical protein